MRIFGILSKKAIVLHPIKTNLVYFENLLKQLCNEGGERTFFLPNGWAQLKIVRGGQPIFNGQEVDFDFPNWFFQGTFHLDNYEPFYSHAMQVAAQQVTENILRVGIDVFSSEVQFINFGQQLSEALIQAYPDAHMTDNEGQSLTKEIVQPAQEDKQVIRNNKTKDRAKDTNGRTKATVAHYAITQKGIKQEVAAARVGISSKTYRTYRDDNYLLTEQDFQGKNGKTIPEYWDELLSTEN